MKVTVTNIRLCIGCFTVTFLRKKEKEPTVFKDAAIPLITKANNFFKFDKWKWSHFHLTTF